MTATVQQTIDELRRTFTEYIEAAYHIGHPQVVLQRRKLLEKVGGIFQIPYLESTPRYVARRTFRELSDLPGPAREALTRISEITAYGKPLIFNPPYTHQAEALEGVLGNKKNLMIMTGTGSGKTESFLLPILGKLAIEAQERPGNFANFNALRAIVLYPMNALVNDQLGRLRLLFGNPEVVNLFQAWAGRPARFARYTSRTPYAGVRTSNKDSTRLSSIGDFFAEIETAARRHQSGRPNIAEEDARAAKLFESLGVKGKWPAKESVAGWFGSPGSRWQDREGAFQRAILGPSDAELLTRHEVQQTPPDLLITNYSMLEYMMMRPIERPIFDRTREWLKACPDERILIVMDEAHLYRGAQGAEVGLLLRRLRERLGVSADRFQVICATASFSEKGKETAGKFGAELTGVAEDSFVPIVGTLATREPAALGTQADVEALCSIDLDTFYRDDAGLRNATGAFLAYRGVLAQEDAEIGLYLALKDYPPFNTLVNETMRAAIPLRDLGAQVFDPTASTELVDKAITAMLALGSRARRAADEPSLLPCRIHSFFRGLPGLWACMDPQCSELEGAERGGPIGKLYGQPLERCGCGAPVLEYYTCRHCGTSYARAYTNDVSNPEYIWAIAGQRLQTDAGAFEAFRPLDLLLESPASPERGRAARYDLQTGRLDPLHPSGSFRYVYLRPEAGALNGDDEGHGERASAGEFVPCACCGRRHGQGKSSVQDHLTKGDQPFQALLGTQIRVQPPGPNPASEFAPLRGRKVLIFSDSRQVAARLAPTLQNYSLRDAVRALAPVGFLMLQNDPHLAGTLSLNHLFLAIVVAAHKFSVRIRPELGQGEAMPSVNVPIGQIPAGADLVELLSAKCPVNLIKAIVNTIKDAGLGLEPLAIASVAENSRLSARIKALPALPGLAIDDEGKLGVARAWLRCWVKGPGIWFNDMPPGWWSVEVTTHRGDFQPMDRILTTRESKRIFKKEWIPRLMSIFSQALQEGGSRVLANHLTLQIGGAWVRCDTCKSVHRPVGMLASCIDCGATAVHAFDPEQDPVFIARRGFYREPVRLAMTQKNPSFVSLIAAEHTAQLNAAQPDDAFSQAENHEIRFQDIDLAWRDTDPREPAIDVLSSTTTMEVGIDIGELSGVALRNMPPGRANYQQRAGRAGRRGTAVATVVAFGSSDSHDDHYFTTPDEMIRGSVIDPKLNLENVDIASRHVSAFLLQRYHEARLPEHDPNANPNLFSVLGSVRDFRDGGSTLNRMDFRDWLTSNRMALALAVDRWLPSQIRGEERAKLIANMSSTVASEVDRAIGYREPLPVAAEIAEEKVLNDVSEEEVVEGMQAGALTEPPVDQQVLASSPDEDTDFADPSADKLLERLLYWGVLPRYAFPTDVAPFYVFNRGLSTEFRPRMDFAPSQSLNVALSQYAPNKQIWIKGKQYTSKAIYSPYRDVRDDAWRKRKLYFECSVCGHAKTENYSEERRNGLFQCEACQTPASFGPGMPWLRPPGFAHPVDRNPVTAPDDPNETAYATRAKLIMQTPGPDLGWIEINHRIRGFPTRDYLLVSNSGPEGEGYNYCVACGRIEAVKDQEINLHQPHSRPFPSNKPELCPGRVSRGIVLGTDFRTDVALFSLPLDAPFRVRPGNDESASALRTLCEAVAAAACRVLEIEPGEVLAEYRPALTDSGAAGLEVELFVYDTLAGGAGFSPQLVSRGEELFEKAYKLLGECPAGCDTSCYRCLRNFRNKMDHYLLDRVLGKQLLEHAMQGGYPSYPKKRVAGSTDILFNDLERQLSDAFAFERDATRSSPGGEIAVPIVARRRSNGEEIWIALSSPIAGNVPADEELRAWSSQSAERLFVYVDDLMIRRHLPAAVDRVRITLG